jgi:hypothetical protein
MPKYIKFFLSIIVLGLFLSFSSIEKSSLYKKAIVTSIDTDTITWKSLALVKYIKKKHPKYGSIQFPIVNDQLKTKGKKVVLISGFLVPIDDENYALSKNVSASCFFCGKAGPESFVGLNFKNGMPKLKTDQYVTIQGVFRYNETNADDWIYNIDKAVIVKGN